MKKWYRKFFLKRPETCRNKVVCGVIEDDTNEIFPPPCSLMNRLSKFSHTTYWAVPMSQPLDFAYILQILSYLLDERKIEADKWWSKIHTHVCLKSTCFCQIPCRVTSCPCQINFFNAELLLFTVNYIYYDIPPLNTLVCISIKNIFHIVKT